MSRRYIRLLATAIAISCIGPMAPPSEPPHTADSVIRRDDALPLGAASSRLGTLKLRHDARVIAAVFSPDGKVIASFGADSHVRFWDSLSGQELRHTRVEFEGIFSAFAEPALTFSTDGQVVAVAANKRVAIVPVRRDLPLRHLPNQDADVTGLVFAPGDQLLAIFGAGRFVSLVDPGTGKERHRIDANHSKVPAVAFSWDGKMVAVGCRDNFIRLAALNDLKNTRKVPTGNFDAVNLAFSPDGKLLAWGDWKGTAHVLDVVTEKEVDSFQVCDSSFFKAPVASLQFTPAGVLQALGSRPATFCSWVLRKAVEREPITLLGERTLFGRLAPDGKRAVFWTENSPALRLLDVATLCEEEPAPGHWWPVSSITVSPDRETVASSGDGTIRLWNLRTGRETRRWEPHGMSGASDIAFAPDGRVLASCAWDGEKWRQGTIRLWNPETGRELQKWNTEANTRLVFSGDGSVLFAAGHTRVQAWDSVKGKLIREMDEVPEATKPPQQIDETAPRIWWQFYDLAASPDGKIVAAMIAQGGGSDRVYLWDATTGKRLPGWQEKGLLSPLAFSPDGKTLAARKQRKEGTMDYDVVLWDVATARERGRVPLTEQLCGSVAFSPDGRFLAVGQAFHGEIHVWSLPDLERVARFRGAEGAVRIAFTADSAALISASKDTSMLVWNLRGLQRPRLK